MRIGFDARMIDHPGIGRYIKNLLKAMLGLNTGCEFLVFGDENKLTTYNLKLTTDQIIRWNAPIYSLQEQIFQPFIKYNLDVVHVPHFNVPFQRRNKLVITIHDLVYLKFPESRPYFRGIVAKRVITNAVKKADRIIAVSENTKRDIIKEFPYAKRKIEVIYEAADPIFCKIDDEMRKENIRKKYKLPRDIILFVGSLKKHKNIERLIDAYTDLKSKVIQHKLIIVGRYRPREAEILRKIESTDALYLGEIPTEDLVSIYNLASLLIIPSLYEGFGLPALEAMACGTPVIASSSASLPEVIGDAGVLFDAQDKSDIFDKIYEVLKDEDLRQGLIKKGFKRTRSFSWVKTALQTIELYKKL